MANLKKPNKALARKGLPPKEEEASNNLSIVEAAESEKMEEKPEANPEKDVKEEIKPLNFKVPNSFRKRFKNFATNNDTTMSELLVECFELYEKNHNK